MSKKSRKRNKKILAALALAGGAALMAKRGKGVAQGVSGSDKAKFTSDAAYSMDSLPKKNWIFKKPKVIVPKIDHGIAYQSSRAAGNYPDYKPAATHVNGVAIKDRINANDPRSTPFHPSQGNVKKAFTMQGDPRGWKGGGIAKRGTGVALKKGGRVTGIAKRGFGRALMKGKK